MELTARWESRNSLETAQRLFDRGDYDGALRENQKVLLKYSQIPPGDESLFRAGMIYAHPGYSKRNVEKALDSFRKLVKTFPQSPFTGQAKIWIEILKEREKLSSELEDSNRHIKKTQHENERLVKENEDLRNVYRKSRQVDIDIEGKKKELTK